MNNIVNVSVCQELTAESDANGTYKINTGIYNFTNGETEVPAFEATATMLADGLMFGVDGVANEGLSGYKIAGTLTGAEAGKKAEVKLGKVDAKSGYSVLLDPNMDYTMRSVGSYVAGPKRFNINTKGDSGVSHTFCMMHVANKENGRVRVNGSGLTVTDIGRTSYQHIVDAFWGKNAKDGGSDDLLQYAVEINGTALTFTLTAIDGETLQPIEGAATWSYTYTATQGFGDNVEVNVYQELVSPDTTNANETTFAFDMGIYNFAEIERAEPVLKAKKNAIKVTALQELTITDLFEYDADGGEIPTFTYTSNNEMFAKVVGGKLNIANVSEGDATITIAAGDKQEEIYVYMNKVAPFTAESVTLVDGLSFAEDEEAAEYGAYGYKLKGTLTGATAGYQAEISLGQVDITKGYKILLDPNMDNVGGVSGNMLTKRIFVRTKDASGNEHIMPMAARWNNDTANIRVTENGSGLNTAFGIGYNLVDIKGLVYIYNKSKGVRSEYGGFDDMGGA